ncbi:MAG: hypothetical protein ACFFF9_15655 [Candidatus Thorarchaeota archaeon]
MKAMGTITKYYPFIDEESKSILSSLMEESSSYYDFVLRLCEVVLEDEIPVNLAYIAAGQAWWCGMNATMKLVEKKYGDVPCIKPWMHIVKTGERDQMLYHDTVVKAIENAIKCSIDDWIETELHILHALFHYPMGEVISQFEPLEKAKGLIDANPLLGCFESMIYAFEGIAAMREGDMKHALDVLQRGKDLAELHDDALYMYWNKLQEAAVLTWGNIYEEAAAVFEDLYELAQNLQVPILVCEVLNDSSLVYEAKGEFDLTISSHHEIMNILDDERLFDTTYIILSRTYATLGDGHQALEWINRGIEDNAPFESPFMYNWKAWALALVNRLDDAERTLETAYLLIVKSGLERHLGDYYYVSGVIELRKGELLNALDLLEKAWDVANQYPRGNNQNRPLLDLVRAENLIASQSRDNTKVAAPGKWLSTLEKYAFDRHLPGIRMYAALLKSEFYESQGQIKNALATLQDALDITDSLGVQTLKRKITTRIKRINQLNQDAGMDS